MHMGGQEKGIPNPCAEGLANHVDEPLYPTEFNPCPWCVEDSAITSSGYAIDPIPLEISQLLSFATMPVYSEYDHAILLYSAYPMKINQAVGQLVQTDVIILFPPRVYGYVSAYCRPGDRPTMDVFPFAINAMKQENRILYLYNTTPSPQYVDQGEVVAMVTLYQSVIPILQICEYTNGKTNVAGQKRKAETNKSATPTAKSGRCP